MEIRVLRIERTPNPNARKFLIATDSPMPIRSFFSADQAASDPLGSALFAVPSVTNVLIHTGFISINKSTDSKWPAVEQAVKEVLSGAH